MKKYIGIFIILLLFSIINCIPKQDINNNENITKEQIISIDYNDNIFLQEEELILNIFYNMNIEDESVLSTFSHLNENISQYYSMTIDNIRIYENINKETNYIEIINKEVMLFKIPESENWLYIITEDLNYYGFIFIYDISNESFYGNLEINSRSGNYYLSRLYKEYDIVKNHQNINRYGPLLEINHNNNVIRFWDSFFGISTVLNYKYLLMDYFEDYNEILIVVVGSGGLRHYVYNIQLGNLVFETGDFPHFNETRDVIIVIDRIFIEFGFDLIIYTLNNGKFTQVRKEGISIIDFNNIDGSYSSKINGYWIDNDTFQIDYVNIILRRDGQREEGGSVIVKKNNLEFELLRN